MECNLKTEFITLYPVTEAKPSMLVLIQEVKIRATVIAERNTLQN